MNIQDVFVGNDQGYCSSSGPYDREKHEWSKWETREEGGLTVITRGQRIGHWESFSKSWQERTCSKCGVVQKTA